MAGQVLVYGFINMHGTLPLHVLNFNWLHMGKISTILSHASCLIKTPTMYLITRPLNIILYILSVYIYMYKVQIAIQLFIIFTIPIQWHYKIICLLDTFLLILESK